MAILENVKIALRIQHSRLDAELTSEIAACKQDLKLAGVATVSDTDDLTITAITTCIRGNHDYAGKGDQYREMYERIKNTMALSPLYNIEVATDA